MMTNKQNNPDLVHNMIFPQVILERVQPANIQFDKN